MSATRLAVLLGAAALGFAAPASADQGAADLEAEIVCPTCKTTLDQSDSPIARRMKAYIRTRLAAGATGNEIKQELVDQFGVGVLAEPAKRGFDLLAWLLPLAAVAVGAVGVGAAAWSWSRRRSTAPVDPLDPELDRRLDDELSRFEE